MNTLPAPEDKRAAVQSMFDRIAGRYDLLNRIMTGGIDRSWRRRTVRMAAIQPGDRVLDLACGTGDFIDVAAAAGATVVGVDFSRGMLRGAQSRQVPGGLVQGDAQAIPLPDASVDAVLSGFALRNFVDLRAALAECARVTRPGGRLAVLEVDRPNNAFMRAANSVYFDRIVPIIGGWLSDREAYAYLPSSVVYLPEQQELHAMLSALGYTAIAKTPLIGGVAQILTATREGA